MFDSLILVWRKLEEERVLKKRFVFDLGLWTLRSGIELDSWGFLYPLLFAVVRRGVFRYCF